MKFYINLTSLIPLSFKGEREVLLLKGFHPFNLPLNSSEKEIAMKKLTLLLDTPYIRLRY